MRIRLSREMNERRHNAAATVINGKIFCCGGHNGTKHLNSIECYDIVSDLWTPFCSMPGPRKGLGAVAINTNLFIMGGWNGQEELRNVYVLDTTNKGAGWIEKSCMSLSRGAFNIAKIEDKILVFGGQSKEDTTDSVEIFDEEAWTNTISLKTPRKYAAITIIPMDFAKYLN